MVQSRFILAQIVGVFFAHGMAVESSCSTSNFYYAIWNSLKLSGGMCQLINCTIQRFQSMLTTT
ncbi:MAG: hypothetical protein HNEKOMLI_00676 [Sodalis sp. Psp]|nr:hypothetical protein [Sodalis sp. Psp]MCR3757142.1 hypothetical protein [Sodalis sp. Ppy]